MGKKNQVLPKTALRIRQIFEELVQQILILELRKQYIFFKVEYSEADESTVIIVEYDGERMDPETVRDQLALTLVQNAVSDLNLVTTEGSRLPNRIFMHIRP